MSIDRGDRVIMMMFRSMCCCGNGSKVGDSSEEIIGKQQLKSVFVVCKKNVLMRSLIGKLIAALEDRHLAPVHMKLLQPTQEMIDKSHLLKDERSRQVDVPWMFLVLRGREAQTRVSDCIRNFKIQYSLHKHDIAWTENEQQAKHEQEVWFKNNEVESISNGDLHVEAAPEQNGMAVESSSVKEEGDEKSNGNSEISTEGPHPSVDSEDPQPAMAPSQPPQEAHEENDEATAEVISNTAEILEPVVAPPPAAPTARPSSSPAVPIVQQPTKIE